MCVRMRVSEQTESDALACLAPVQRLELWSSALGWDAGDKRTARQPATLDCGLTLAGASGMVSDTWYLP